MVGNGNKFALLQSVTPRRELVTLSDADGPRQTSRVACTMQTLEVLYWLEPDKVGSTTSIANFCEYYVQVTTTGVTSESYMSSSSLLGTTQPFLLCVKSRRGSRPRKVRRRHIRIALHNVRLRLGQLRNHIVGQVQRVLDNLRRRQAKPLVHGDVGELGRLQDLEQHEVVRARVLNVMAGRLRNVADAAGIVVERPGALRRLEDGDASRPGEEKVPLVAGEMPVELAHGARLDGDERGAEHAGDGEGGRVEDLDGAAFDLVWLLLRKVVRVALLFRQEAGWTGNLLLLDVVGSGRPRENPELAVWKIVKCGNVGLQVLCKRRLGVALEQLGSQKGSFFGELAIVKNQEELGSVFQSLDGMWHARREEPDVACVEVVDKGLAILVGGLNAHGTVKNVGPLVCRMPVEFAVSAGRKTHVDTSHGSSIWKNGLVLLTSPTGAIQTTTVMA